MSKETKLCPGTFELIFKDKIPLAENARLRNTMQILIAELIGEKIRENEEPLLFY